MRAAIYTLGCKVNTCESSEIGEQLLAAGYQLVKKGDEADVYIVNSCTVTEESSRKTRQLLRRLKREHPGAVTVLTGCYPQAFPTEAQGFLQADIVLGNRNNRALLDTLNRFFRERERRVAILPHETDERFYGGILSSTEGHTRAFLKIQDGCNRFCSYCVIPYARGRSRSRTLAETAASAEALAANGYHEIVLVGINLSAYGRDFGDTDLADAVQAVSAPPQIRRVRLGSLEPDHLTPSLIEKLQTCEKLCPQFHISLQSGSGGVLRRMNRHYTAEEYAALVQTLRASFADCTITTDIICGFPGESEEEFAQTLDFAEKIGFEKAHIFPYSPRAGTRAAAYEGQIPQKIKEARCAQLSEICENSRRRWLSSQCGRVVEVLFETPKNGFARGYTASYLPVRVRDEAGQIQPGSLRRVRILSVQGEGCIGEMAET